MKKFGMKKLVITTVCVIYVICMAIVIASADKGETRVNWSTAWDDAYEWSQKFHYDERIRMSYVDDHGVYRAIGTLEREELCARLNCDYSGLEEAMKSETFENVIRAELGTDDVYAIGFYHKTSKNNVDIYTVWMMSDETDLAEYEDGIQTMAKIIVGVY